MFKKKFIVISSIVLILFSLLLTFFIFNRTDLNFAKQGTAIFKYSNTDISQQLSDEDFKKIIDNLPNHEPHIYIMPWLFNQKFDEDTMKNIYATTPFLKLTYKQEYYRQTPSGEQTFYNYFIKLD